MKGGQGIPQAWVVQSNDHAISAQHQEAVNAEIANMVRFPSHTAVNSGRADQRVSSSSEELGTAGGQFRPAQRDLPTSFKKKWNITP